MTYEVALHNLSPLVHMKSKKIRNMESGAHIVLEERICEAGH